MEIPKLACCNFIPDVKKLKAFAQQHAFQGIDWSFYLDTLPRDLADESALLKRIRSLDPLEVRYHCSFKKMDLGDLDSSKAEEATNLLRRVCLLVSRLGGRVLTIHVGLGLETTEELSWDRTLKRLAELTNFAHGLGLKLCLENLAWGWTSRPELYEKLLRKSGAWATLDIGHAIVSPSVASQQYTLVDFVSPHRERFLNAHIYHKENHEGHLPPDSLAVLRERLQLLQALPLCHWWVLELREEGPLLKTLRFVRHFIQDAG
jgi:sugar phosphate isomerase/epimerase